MGTTSFGTTTLTSNGWDEIFVAKLDSNGNWLGQSKLEEVVPIVV
jgi:hypothetical protein